MREVNQIRVKLIKTTQTLHLIGPLIPEGLLFQGDERFSTCVFDFCPFLFNTRGGAVNVMPVTSCAHLIGEVGSKVS